MLRWKRKGGVRKVRPKHCRGAKKGRASAPARGAPADQPNDVAIRFASPYRRPVFVADHYLSMRPFTPGFRVGQHAPPIQQRLLTPPRSAHLLGWHGKRISFSATRNSARACFSRAEPIPFMFLFIRLLFSTIEDADKKYSKAIFPIKMPVNERCARFVDEHKASKKNNVSARNRFVPASTYRTKNSFCQLAR